MRNIALEKSTGECLHDFELGRDFLSSIQNALNPVGKKKDKSDYIKKFYSSKNPIKRKKRQTMDWEILQICLCLLNFIKENSDIGI